MRPPTTGAGKPMVTASYFQPTVAWRTTSAICWAVMPGPEWNFFISVPPDSLSLTLVPPTSITRTFITRPPGPFRPWNYTPDLPRRPSWASVTIGPDWRRRHERGDRSPP